jgi:hypothetical protein
VSILGLGNYMNLGMLQAPNEVLETKPVGSCFSCEPERLIALPGACKHIDVPPPSPFTHVGFSQEPSSTKSEHALIMYPSVALECTTCPLSALCGFR